MVTRIAGLRGLDGSRHEREFGGAIEDGPRARRWLWFVLFCTGCAELLGADFEGLEPTESAVTGGGGSAGDASLADGGDFPKTPLLDDFSSESTLETNWDAEFTYFYVAEGELVCKSCSVGALWSEGFGEQQEVYTEVRGIGADAIEYNLILRAQCAHCGLIEALYDPREQAVYVAYCVDDCLDLGNWVYSEPTSVTLDVGDQFGARIDAANLVEVYKNGSRVTAHRVEEFPYKQGQIGVSGIQNAGENAYDDFGGGNW